MADESSVQWRTSTRSMAEGNCVEIGGRPGAVSVRDTKDRDGGTLSVSRGAWTTFTDAVRTGRLD